ncbi:hypothetical protein EVAR_71090_1 [Eumeta japonica]|uniref:Uncharacterized protein n=1 Tax=Eumeta variegata TaxID=151549 RepID=A0A4C1TT76_EUMVA|nr:hypothetical protein EVAR_71090_1 [Eumeta japonica]
MLMLFDNSVQFGPAYYPQYIFSYYPPHNNGFVGGYQQQALGQQIHYGTSQQQALGQQINSGASLGGYQQQILGQQPSLGISLGGYQQQALGQHSSSGTSLAGYQQQTLGQQMNTELPWEAIKAWFDNTSYFSTISGFK